VILSTLVLQGLTFPALVRRLGVREAADEAEESRVARDHLLAAGLQAVDRTAREESLDAETAKEVLLEYQRRRGNLRDGLVEALGWSPERHRLLTRRRLEEAALHAQRLELQRLRRVGELPEELRLHLENELDLEEARLRS